MSHRMLVLFFWCGTQVVISASLANAQFFDAVRGEYGTENRLRSEGEATSVGDPGDPRQETRSSRFGRDLSDDIDPFRDRLVDPRLGDAFDPAEAADRRFFKANRGGEREDEQVVSPITTRPFARPRRVDSAGRAQFVTRLDARLQEAVRKNRREHDRILQRVRTSLKALCGESVVASNDGGVIVLRGSAEDDYRRRMIERFVLLEPGVDKVRNEINRIPAPVIVAPPGELHAPAAAPKMAPTGQRGVLLPAENQRP